EVVKEMAHDLESMAGAEEKPASAAASAESAPSSVERPLFERPRSLREAVKLVRERAPQALEALREKAEERLEQMPAPVKTVVRRPGYRTEGAPADRGRRAQGEAAASVGPPDPAPAPRRGGPPAARGGAPRRVDPQRGAAARLRPLPGLALPRRRTHFDSGVP